MAKEVKTIICRKVKHKSSHPKVNCKFSFITYSMCTECQAPSHSHKICVVKSNRYILCYRIYYANTLNANANWCWVAKNDTRAQNSLTHTAPPLARCMLWACDPRAGFQLADRHQLEKLELYKQAIRGFLLGHIYAALCLALSAIMAVGIDDVYGFWLIYQIKWGQNAFIFCIQLAILAIKSQQNCQR